MTAPLSGTVVAPPRTLLQQKRCSCFSCSCTRRAAFMCARSRSNQSTPPASMGDLNEPTSAQQSPPRGPPASCAALVGRWPMELRSGGVTARLDWRIGGSGCPPPDAPARRLPVWRRATPAPLPHEGRPRGRRLCSGRGLCLLVAAPRWRRAPSIGHRGPLPMPRGGSPPPCLVPTHLGSLQGPDGVQARRACGERPIVFRRPA